jgi:hypothetical protein
MKRFKWSFYWLDSGLFTSSSYSAPTTKHLKENTPAGCGAVLGSYDADSQRVIDRGEVDPVTGAGVEPGDIILVDGDTIKAIAVMDYQPPQPSSDHVWLHDDELGNRVRRWVLTKEAYERNQERAWTMFEILKLEAQQPRAMRELLLNPNDTNAIQRLDGIDTRIAELRIKLKR